MHTTFFGSLSSSVKQDEAHAADMAKAMAVQQIYTAIFAHENWKHRLLTFVEGISTEVFATEDFYVVERTELGQWIDTVGKAKFSTYIEFALVVEYHKMLHHAAVNAVSRLEMHHDDVSRQQEVTHLLTGQFEKFSDAIIANLLKLREKVEAAH